MMRSRSTDFSRPTYENISSRLNRLRSPALNLNLPSNSNYRSSLNVLENGIMAKPSEGLVGRVSKNTGIRKYN